MGGSGFLNFKILEALLCCITADFKFVLSNSVVPDSLVNPWAVAHQAPLFIGFSRKNTGVLFDFLFQRIFSTEGSEPTSPESLVLTSGFFFNTELLGSLILRLGQS